MTDDRPVNRYNIPACEIRPLVHAANKCFVYAGILGYTQVTKTELLRVTADSHVKVRVDVYPDTLSLFVTDPL